MGLGLLDRSVDQSILIIFTVRTTWYFLLLVLLEVLCDQEYPTRRLPHIASSRYSVDTTEYSVLTGIPPTYLEE